MVHYLEQWPPVLCEVPESDNVNRIVIRNNQFSPKFQLIPVGSTVEIINEDSILHNTHIDDGHNTVFNVATPLKSVIVRKALTVTDLLNVRCDLHPNMYGWAFVPPSPHFAVVQESESHTVDRHCAWYLPINRLASRADFQTPNPRTRTRKTVQT